MSGVVFVISIPTAEYEQVLTDKLKKKVVISEQATSSEKCNLSPKGRLKNKLSNSKEHLLSEKEESVNLEDNYYYDEENETQNESTSERPSLEQVSEFIKKIYV